MARNDEVFAINGIFYRNGLPKGRAVAINAEFTYTAEHGRRHKSAMEVHGQTYTADIPAGDISKPKLFLRALGGPDALADGPTSEEGWNELAQIYDGMRQGQLKPVSKPTEIFNHTDAEGNARLFDKGRELASFALIDVKQKPISWEQIGNGTQKELDYHSRQYTVTAEHQGQEVVFDYGFDYVRNVGSRTAAELSGIPSMHVPNWVAFQVAARSMFAEEFAKPLRTFKAGEVYDLQGRKVFFPKKYLRQ